LFVKNKLQPRQSNNGVTMQVTASKVRVDFTRLLSQLSAGPVEITKHGKVVAVLVHPDDLATGTETTTTSPDEPLEAVQASEPTQDTSETPDASQTPSTACEGVPLASRQALVEEIAMHIAAVNQAHAASKATNAAQTPTTVCQSVPLEAEEEGEESSDADESGPANSAWGWSAEEEENFERYLSSIEPDSSEFSEPMPF